MTDQSDLRGLAARHANEPPQVTVAECLRHAAYWINRAAEIGQTELTAEAAEVERWRSRAVEAERELRAMKDLDSKEIV